MRNNPIPSPPFGNLGTACRSQRSKALIAIAAVLGVTVMAMEAQANPSLIPGTTPRVAAPVFLAKSGSKIVCADCGTVLSVTAVKRQGQVNGVPVGNTTIGVGTVAGGVIGGLLGNQVGNGNGKTAATVVGIAGGAYAGNAVEKNMKKVTVYDVRIRMDDGTTRHLDISTSVPVGSKVIVEGKNLRLATAKG